MVVTKMRLSMCLRHEGAVDSSGGGRPSPLVLSQQDGGVEGSLTRVVPERAGAALTKPGRFSTVRWAGSGKRDGKEYARNRCQTALDQMRLASAQGNFVAVASVPSSSAEGEENNCGARRS